MQRLAKAISNAGICSRRDAEALIKAGEVKLDGVVVTSPAISIDKNAKIEVSGKLVNQEQIPRLWIYYKPSGLITTHKDTHFRKTVFEDLSNLPRVISIGRLDINSEGLLLLTNNGDLARKFELPLNQIERVYRVRAFGNPKSLLLADYRKGIIIDSICYKPKSIKLLNWTSEKTNIWFEVILTEGKNREIRRLFEYYGLVVNRLIRIRYGDFILGDLTPRGILEKFSHTRG